MDEEWEGSGWICGVLQKNCDNSLCWPNNNLSLFAASNLKNNILITQLQHV